MAKFEGPLEDVLGICPTCQYWTQYKEGEITIEQMRENCALRCKQHPDLKNNRGIYKATRILYINPTLYRAIMDMDTTKSKEVLDSFEKIVKVPQSRFNTGVKLNDGTSVGETTGGYVR